MPEFARSEEAPAEANEGISGNSWHGCSADQRGESHGGWQYRAEQQGSNYKHDSNRVAWLLVF